MKRLSDAVLNALEKMEAAGVEFCIPGMYSVSSADALRFLADPEGVYADLEGVTKDQLRSYHESFGRIQCAARTKAGHRCKNGIGDHRCYRPKEWVERDRQVQLQDECCGIHRRDIDGHKTLR